MQKALKQVELLIEPVIQQKIFFLSPVSRPAMPDESLQNTKMAEPFTAVHGFQWSGETQASLSSLRQTCVASDGSNLAIFLFRNPIFCNISFSPVD